MTERDLTQWIRDNMTVDEDSILMANKEEVSKLVGVTTDGKVVLKIEKTKLNGQQLVLLYLLGKLFAKVAGYAQERSATNSEISIELGVPPGSVGRCLLELRKQGVVRDGSVGGHELILSSIPSILNVLKGGDEKRLDA